VGEACAEWKILRAVAAATYPERAHLLKCETGQAMREIFSGAAAGRPRDAGDTAYPRPTA
jgi:hypothetical protein